jgi:hypothetical protein
MPTAHEAFSRGPAREVGCSRTHIDTGQSMKFNNTCRLAKVKGYVDHLVKEAIEIQLHPNNFNRDGGFMLS